MDTKKFLSLPSINVIEYLISTFLAVLEYQIVSYPSDEVVLKGPLDDLVEKVGCHYFMNICSRKVMCKRLIHRNLSNER